MKRAVSPQVVNAFYDAAQRISEATLEGNGVFHVPRQTHLQPITTHAPSNAATRADIIDAHIATIPPDKRKEIADFFLNDARASYKPGMRNSLPDIDRGNAPTSAVEFAETYTEVIIPAIAAFVDSLPDAMRVDVAPYFSHEFVEAMRTVHLYGIAHGYVQLDAPQGSAQVIPSAFYAMDIAGSRRADIQLRKRRTFEQWTADKAAVVTLGLSRVIYREEPEGLPYKYRESAKLRHVVRNWLWGNISPGRHTATLDDLVEHACAHITYEDAAWYRDSVVDFGEVVLRYNPGREDIRTHIESIRQREIRTNLPEERRVPEEAMPQNGRTTPFDRLLETSTDPQGNAIKTMMSAHWRVADAWRAGPVETITKSRTKGRESEGILYRHDKFFEGMEHHLNERRYIGWIPHLVHNQQDRFFAAIRYLGLEGSSILNVFNLANQQQATDRVQRQVITAKQTVHVRPNYPGHVAQWLSPFIVKRAWSYLYGNMADGDEFYSKWKMLKQMAAQSIDPRQWGALLNDIRERKTIPDNPLTATVARSDTIDRARAALRPVYCDQERGRLLYDHLQISANDYPRDPNNVAALLAIGMINARLGEKESTEKFLTMASTWADKAISLHAGGVHEKVVAEYELSRYYQRTDREKREMHLLAAYEAWQRSPAHTHLTEDRAPRDLADHVLSYPLDFDARRQHIEFGKLRPLERERAVLAAHDDLAVILASEQVSATLRPELEQYLEYFESQMGTHRPSYLRPKAEKAAKSEPKVSKPDLAPAVLRLGPRLVTMGMGGGYMSRSLEEPRSLEDKLRETGTGTTAPNREYLGDARELYARKTADGFVLVDPPKQLPGAGTPEYTEFFETVLCPLEGMLGGYKQR